MSHRLLGGSAQARSERLAISSSLKKTAVQYQRTRRPVLRTKPADQAEDRRHRNRLKNRIPRNTAKYGRSDLVGNARLLSFVPKLFSPRVAPSSGQRGGGRQVYFKSLTVSGGVRSPRVQRSALLAARTILERTTEVGRRRSNQIYRISRYFAVFDFESDPILLPVSHSHRGTPLNRCFEWMSAYATTSVISASCLSD